MAELLVVLLSLLFAVVSCYDSPSSASSTSPGVFEVGPVATAGAQTVVKFNLSASSCSSPLQDDGCDFPYARLQLMADASYNITHEGIIVWEHYCYISSCVSTNLTSFEISIPRSAVPDGWPYTFTYSLFRPESNGSLTYSYPIWAAFDSPSFNITGSNTTWTDYDKTGRFWSDNGNRPWFSNLTCEALECARQCAEDIEAPLVPYVGGPIPKLDACVEACPGMGWDPTKCITENAAVPASPSSTDSSPAPTTSNAASSVSSNAAGKTATPAATIKSAGIQTSCSRLVLVLAAANIFLCTWSTFH